MKKYEDNQKKKVKKQETTGSDIACAEPKCEGEMMILLPELKHPTLDLKRAVCGICGWRGWV